VAGAAAATCYLEARVQPAFADLAMPEGPVVLVGERR
jgi:hypothetical protein